MEQPKITLEHSQLQEMQEKLQKWVSNLQTNLFLQLKISPPEVLQVLETLKKCKITKPQLKVRLEKGKN